MSKYLNLLSAVGIILSSDVSVVSAESTGLEEDSVKINRANAGYQEIGVSEFDALYKGNGTCVGNGTCR